jgi:hypothetical protein
MNASIKTAGKIVKHPVVMALLAALILYVCYLAYKKFFKKNGPKIMLPIYEDNKPTQLPTCPGCAKPTQLPACPDCAKPTQLPWIPDDI